MLTRADDLYEKRRLGTKSENLYGYFSTKQDYCMFWWGRKQTDEWSPRFSRRWWYHYNTYKHAKENWAAYRVDSLYRQVFGGLSNLLPTPTSKVLKWLTNTSLFDLLVQATAFALSIVDQYTTTFKDRFKLFWNYPTDKTIPKRFVRWFFTQKHQEKLVKVKVKNSLTSTKKTKSQLIQKLNNFNKVI